MVAKHRPRKLAGETVVYNTLFEKSIIDRVHQLAAEREISSPEFIRQAVSEKLTGTAVSVPFKETSPVDPISNQGFLEGVVAALDEVRQSPRLQMELATGQKIGEVIADQIYCDLVGQTHAEDEERVFIPSDHTPEPEEAEDGPEFTETAEELAFLGTENEDGSDEPDEEERRERERWLSYQEDIDNPEGQ